MPRNDGTSSVLTEWLFCLQLVVIVVHGSFQQYLPSIVSFSLSQTGCLTIYFSWESYIDKYSSQGKTSLTLRAPVLLSHTTYIKGAKMCYSDPLLFLKVSPPLSDALWLCTTLSSNLQC